MQEVFKIIGQVTASDVTVMITGESGTGKELVARSIWKHSHRANKPFIAVNCAAIPDNLIESELFGHEKGSFTGATGQRLGKFELCDGGTIFLDEIGDMALATQTKILRVLQQGEIQRVGGTETIQVDVRIIAATNKDLEEMVKAKTFREDLYYRLNVVRIKMPPLRDRPEDIPADRRFLPAEPGQAAQGAGGQGRARRRWPCSPATAGRATSASWRTSIYRSAVIAQGDAILVKDLPAEIRGIAAGAAPAGPEAAATAPRPQLVAAAPAAPLRAEEPVAVSPAPVAEPASESAPDSGLKLKTALDFVFGQFAAGDQPIMASIEREMIERALRLEHGDQAAAGKRLGITKTALQKRLK